MIPTVTAELADARAQLTEQQAIAELLVFRAPAAGRVYAKTGTTSISSALAGYVGGRYAFAVLTNGDPVSSWWARRAQDRFVTVLAR